ncbi:hypothetical protein AAMO2058_000916900 [Amorphochlora amoebiformis]
MIMQESLERERTEHQKALEVAKTRHLEDHRNAELKAKENYQRLVDTMAAKVEKENLSEIAKRDKIIEIEHRAKADLEADLYRLRTKLQRALKAEERVGESKEDALESKYRSLSELVERLRRSKTDLEAKLSASKALEAQAIEAQKQTDKLKFDYLQLRQQLADKKHEAELASKVLIL